jgi:hypothetical protein
VATTIGVLRMADASRVRAEAAAAALDLSAADHDRSVLIVRHLRVTADDRDQARAELATAREHAPRPSLGPADPAAAAVLFADEAEMLACLTRDVAVGHRSWYWEHVLPRSAGRASAALAAVWTAHARWLPAALALLTAEESVAAVRLIAPADIGRVLAALAAEFAVPGPLPAQHGAGPALGPGTVLISDHIAAWPPGAARPAPGRPAAAEPGDAAELARAEPCPAPPPVLPAAAASLPAAARALLGLCQTLGRPMQEPGSGPEPLASQPSHGLDVRPEPRASHQAPRQMEGNSITSGGQLLAEMTLPARTPGEADARLGSPGAGPGLARAGTMPTAAGVPPWDPAFATSAASALYTVNLLEWLAIPRPDWPAVELLARHVLGGQLDELGDEPLWDMLAVLDGREPGTAAKPPVVFPDVTERMDALLAVHELGVITFHRPGRIALTRTHLDVLLSLDDVDLAARRCGLDQDPGWVPSLRRIVAFHFLGGTELLR